MQFGPHLMLALIEGAVMAAVLALMASGLSLVFGVLRVVNVAHGEFYMLGAVAAWGVASLVVSPGWGFVAALVVAPLLVGALAWGLDALVLRRLAGDPDRTVLATVGMLYILQQGALMGYGPFARPVAAPFNSRIALPWLGQGPDSWGLIWPWGLSITTYKLFVIAAAVTVLVALGLFLTRTRAGLVMRATEADRDTARAFGVPVAHVFGGVFALGAGLAALAGVLIVPITQAHYLMGGDALLLSFIVVIIGGLGSLRGTLMAAVLIGLGDGVLSVFFSPLLAKIAATLLVAAVLVWRPAGLFGGRAR